MVEDPVQDFAPTTSPTTVSPEEQRSLAGAVRATVRNQTIDLLQRRGLLAETGDLLECPKCGDRVILLDQPATFVFDREGKTRICSACGAERDFIHMFRPDADIGGEGG